MTLPDAQKSRAVLMAWLVPSLLGVITSLMVLGGTIFIGIMTRQADEIHGLRDDFQKSQVLMEARVTRLEDALIRHVYIDAEDYTSALTHSATPTPRPILPILPKFHVKERPKKP
jgi:hypothetical protein